jgi:hypothetical protein
MATTGEFYRVDEELIVIVRIPCYWMARGGNSMSRAVLAPELQDGDSRATPELKDDS